MDELEAAAREYRRAEKVMDIARARLFDAIVRAARAGERQTDIVRVTGLTRERVRQICRQAGISPKT